MTKTKNYYRPLLAIPVILALCVIPYIQELHYKHVSNQRVEAWEAGYFQAYADAITHKGWVNVPSYPPLPRRKPMI
jgi:hypothetical protein